MIGLQFFHLCKVLLALHYPLQTTGINLLRFVRLIEVHTLYWSPLDVKQYTDFWNRYSARRRSPSIRISCVELCVV